MFPLHPQVIRKIPDEAAGQGCREIFAVRTVPRKFFAQHVQDLHIVADDNVERIKSHERIPTPRAVTQTALEQESIRLVPEHLKKINACAAEINCSVRAAEGHIVVKDNVDA